MSCQGLMQSVYRFLSEPMVYIVPCTSTRETEMTSWETVKQSPLTGTWIDAEGKPLQKQWKSGKSVYSHEERIEQYLVVQEKVRHFSLVERVVRGGIGAFFVVLSFGKMLATKECKSLLFAEKEVALFVTKQSDVFNPSYELVPFGDEISQRNGIQFSSHPKIAFIPRITGVAMKCLEVQRTLIPEPQTVEEVVLPQPKPSILKTM